MSHVIYMAINKVNGKKYVGFDSNWPSRKKHHENQTFRTPGTKGYSKTNFHNALRKYGFENFDWVVLETYEPIDEFDRYCLNVLEPKHISEQNSFEEGYNSTLGGEGSYGFRFTEEQRNELKRGLKERGHPMKGRSHSEETRKTLSEKNKGARNLTEEQLEQLRANSKNYWYSLSEEEQKEKIEKTASKLRGKPRSEETKKKISEANKNPSQETRKKISDSQKGKTHSEETKKKISESGKGRIVSEETRKKISESKTGEKRTPEQRKRISDSQKKRSAEKDYVNPFSKSVEVEGVFYSSIEEAKNKTGLSRGKIKKLNNI